jgi:hypothetical protein
MEQPPGTANGLLRCKSNYWEARMSKADKYQRFAEACLEIATTAKDNKIKAALMHMAQVWLRLAANQTKEVETDEAG